jgi:hypothetical protein
MNIKAKAFSNQILIIFGYFHCERGENSDKGSEKNGKRKGEN